MKKFLVVFIIICLLFSFSGCYEEEGDGDITSGTWRQSNFMYNNIPQSGSVDNLIVCIGLGQRSYLDPLSVDPIRSVLLVSHDWSFLTSKDFSDVLILDEFDDYYTINKYIWIEGVDVIGSTKKRYEDIEDYPDNTIYIPYLKSFTIPAEFFKEQTGTFDIILCFVKSIEYPNYQTIDLRHAVEIDYSINGNSISLTPKYQSNYHFPNKYIAYTYNG